MTSKARGFRGFRWRLYVARMCGGKVAHRTRADAQRHADELNAKLNWPFRHDPYECLCCGWFHVGALSGNRPPFDSTRLRKAIAAGERLRVCKQCRQAKERAA